MPTIAPAACVKTRREMRFKPATSTTDGNNTMSLVPTYGRTSPPATVDTQTLGTPVGSARMAAAMTLVPPEPPMPMMPASRPDLCNWAASTAAPIAMTFIARPRSAACAETLQVSAASMGDHIGLNIHCKEVSGSQSAEVDSNNFCTLSDHRVAQEGVFGTFRVEGAKHHNCRVRLVHCIIIRSLTAIAVLLVEFNHFSGFKNCPLRQARDDVRMIFL